jgi:hypothetical protein
MSQYVVIIYLYIYIGYKILRCVSVQGSAVLGLLSNKIDNFACRKTVHEGTCNIVHGLNLDTVLILHILVIPSDINTRFVGKFADCYCCNCYRERR